MQPATVSGPAAPHRRRPPHGAGQGGSGCAVAEGGDEHEIIEVSTPCCRTRDHGDAHLRQRGGPTRRHHAGHHGGDRRARRQDRHHQTQSGQQRHGRPRIRKNVATLPAVLHPASVAGARRRDRRRIGGDRVCATHRRRRRQRRARRFPHRRVGGAQRPRGAGSGKTPL